MQIVIDIDEHIYKQIMADSEVYILDNEVGRILIENAIYAGTPLPEHHGRLIDADSIISEINKRIEKCREEHGCYGNSYDARCFNLYNIVIDIINNAQTANIERGDEDV